MSRKLVFLDFDDFLVNTNKLSPFCSVKFLRGEETNIWNGNKEGNAQFFQDRLKKTRDNKRKKQIEVIYIILSSRSAFDPACIEVMTQLKDYLYVNPNIKRQKENDFYYTKFPNTDSGPKHFCLHKNHSCLDECKTDEVKMSGVSGFIITRKPKFEVMAYVAENLEIDPQDVCLVDDRKKSHLEEAQKLRDSGMDIPEFYCVDAVELRNTKYQPELSIQHAERIMAELNEVLEIEPSNSYVYTESKVEFIQKAGKTKIEFKEIWNLTNNLADKKESIDSLKDYISSNHLTPFTPIKSKNNFEKKPEDSIAFCIYLLLVKYKNLKSELEKSYCFFPYKNLKLEKKNGIVLLIENLFEHMQDNENKGTSVKNIVNDVLRKHPTLRAGRWGHETSDAIQFLLNTYVSEYPIRYTLYGCGNLQSGICRPLKRTVPDVAPRDYKVNPLEFPG